MSSEKSLNLEQLGDAYEIIGELAGRTDAKTFIGTRRADGRAVMIVVSATPAGDEGNALSHAAADANLLSSRRHDNLLPIVAGSWLGTDAFAAILERPNAPSLGELLSRRDEEFTFPRIANILREANEVLEWARAQKVVHRTVTPETLFVEPGSDKVFVSFAVRPLPLGGLPGADADARCIATLARAMLTRSPSAPEREQQPLAELRPGLPHRLVEDTEALLHASRDAAALPDISVYIAQIAMADAVKSGEVHLAETRSTMEQEQRVLREQLEKERREHDAQITKERRAHEEQLTAERTSHERDVADQAKRLLKERQAFEQQRSKERKALEKEQAAIAKERSAIATQAGLYAHTSELPTPVEPMPVVASTPRIVAGRGRGRPSLKPQWMVLASAVAVALLLVVGVTAFALRGRSLSGAQARATAAQVFDSVAGGIALTPASLTTADSVANGAIVVDSAPKPRPMRPRQSFVASDSTALREAARRDSAARDTTPRIDTIFTSPRRDSRAASDSLQPRVDSMPKRDSLRKADTLQKRDTLPQRFR